MVSDGKVVSGGKGYILAQREVLDFVGLIPGNSPEYPLMIMGNHQYFERNCLKNA
jgi:hypothetical protein